MDIRGKTLFKSFTALRVRWPKMDVGDVYIDSQLPYMTKDDEDDGRLQS
jgi:hypothetical protein